MPSNTPPCCSRSCACVNTVTPADTATPRATRTNLGAIFALAIGIPAVLLGVGLIGAPEKSAPLPGVPVVLAAPEPGTPPAPEAETVHTPGVIRHGIPEPIAKPAGAIRIATYNVENLFGTVKPKVPGDAGGSEEESSADAKPAEHKAAVAKAIHAVNADILALEEIESKETLIRFRDDYLADMGYDHVSSIDAGDARGIEQSVLSRFPITSESNWVKRDLGGVHPETVGNSRNSDAGKPITFHRSPLKVTIEVPGTAAGSPTGPSDASARPYSLTLLVVHSKSGRFDYWREKESAGTIALAKELTDADPNASIVILGDFNGRPNDKSVRMFTDAGWIDAFADIRQGPAGGENGGGGGGERRVRTDPKYITHASNRAIDLILLSPAAARKLVKDTRFVLGTMQRPDGVDYRTTLPPVGYASDHYPVVIDLKP